jgi:hypothetical protein
LDLLVFLLVPLAAFHIAGRCRIGWVFGVFGLFASLPFLILYLASRYTSWIWGGPPGWVWIVGSSMFVIGVGLLCRGVAKLRHRIMDRKRDPGFCRVCKYNLTGNVSGMCPECGTAIEEDGESPPATRAEDKPRRGDSQ